MKDLEILIEKKGVDSQTRFDYSQFDDLFMNIVKSQNRLGLITVGDLECAMNALAKSERSLLDTPLIEKSDKLKAVKTQTLLADLVSYYVSDNHFFVRKYLGISV